MREELLEAGHVLAEHPKGVERPVAPEDGGLGHLPLLVGRGARIPEEDGADRGERKLVGIFVGVVDAEETRLRDSIGKVEVHEALPGRGIEQHFAIEGLPAGEGEGPAAGGGHDLVGDDVDVGHVAPVDRHDEMNL